METQTLVIIILSVVLIIVLVVSRITEMKNKQTYTELMTRIDTLKTYNTITNSSCDIPYPVYYINMDKDQNRRQYMETQLSQIAKEYHRIRGFNGHAIKDIHSDTVDGISFKNFYNDMTKSEVGCTVSHLLSIKAGYESSADIVMICEDDVMFDTCTLAPPISEIVSKAPKDWEILQLIVIQNDLPKIYSKLQGFPQIEYVKREEDKLFWSTACYLVHRRGLNKIMSIVGSGKETISILPIREVNSVPYPHQGQADTYILDLCTTYSVLPCPFLVDNTNLASTIHDDHTPWHLKNSLLLLSKFNELSSKQLLFSKALLDMDMILSKNKQTYFLTAGTCLGAVREGKFIEHDGDIDLGIFVTDYNPDIEKKILEKFKLKHRLGSIDSGYEVTYVHPNGVSIDIFLYYRENDYLWCASYFSLCDRAKNKMCRWKYTPFDLKSIKFLSNIFNVPSPVDTFLSESYGSDWRIPRKFSYTEGLTGGYRNLIYDDFGYEGTFTTPTVYQYWEGKMPEYIKTCMNSVQKACQADGINYVRLTPDNLNQYVDNLPDNWYKLTQIAHKADYVRAVVLYKYGGIWLDADTLAQSNLKMLAEDLKNTDWVVFADENDEFSIGVIGIRKGSPLLKKWIDGMNDKLKDRFDFQWTELGYDILYPIWKSWRADNKDVWRAKVYRNTDTCFPLLWNEWEQFFKDGSCDFLYRKPQPVVSFYNAMFPKWFKELNEREFNDYIRSSNSVIADLFRRSGY